MRTTTIYIHSNIGLHFCISVTSNNKIVTFFAHLQSDLEASRLRPANFCVCNSSSSSSSGSSSNNNNSALNQRQTTRKQDTKTTFCSCDLNFDPMTFIHALDLDILKMYLYTKMDFLGQGFQKLQHYRQTDTQTDAETDATENITTPHSRMVIKKKQCVCLSLG